jgi:hypothetical protein
LSKNAQFESPPDKDARKLFKITFGRCIHPLFFFLAFDYNAKPDKFYFEAEVNLFFLVESNAFT